MEIECYAYDNFQNIDFFKKFKEISINSCQNNKIKKKYIYISQNNEDKKRIKEELVSLEDTILKKYEYEYKPIVYTKDIVFNTLFDDEDEDTIHQLETIDVEENKDGLTIIDPFDGNVMFINDDDLIYLYEIIKERLVKKY